MFTSSHETASSGPASTTPRASAPRLSQLIGVGHTSSEAFDGAHWCADARSRTCPSAQLREQIIADLDTAGTRIGTFRVAPVAGQSRAGL